MKHAQKTGWFNFQEDEEKLNNGAKWVKREFEKKMGKAYDVKVSTQSPTRPAVTNGRKGTRLTPNPVVQAVPIEFNVCPFSLHLSRLLQTLTIAREGSLG